jgi:hypothetical protein
MVKMVKTCSRCKELKDVNLFYKSNTVKGGYQGYCKECHLDANYDNVSRLRLTGPTLHPDSKICRGCSTRKPISQFGVKTGVIDGKLPYCKPCWVDYVRRAKARKAIRDSKA